MFESAAIKAIIQNHKDAPHLWEYRKRSSVVVSIKFNTGIEWHSHFSSLYKVEIEGVDYRNDLNMFDKFALTHYFKKAYSGTNSVPILPTKSTSPESFI